MARYYRTVLDIGHTSQGFDLRIRSNAHSHRSSIDVAFYTKMDFSELLQLLEDELSRRHHVEQQQLF